METDIHLLDKESDSSAKYGANTNIEAAEDKYN